MENSPSHGSLACSSSFQQQGTTDWTQLASSLVRYSLDVLSRFSAANVDTYTVEVGKILASDFQLSAGGRNNVSDALASLHSYRSLGDALWFGFGIRHIVRSIPMTENGFMCLTLCGALAEFYHESIAAEILFELAKSLKAPPQFMPSMMQWRALFRTCTGVFARSDFGVLAEQYVHQNPYAFMHDHNMMDFQRTSCDSCATPVTIADALKGIASVSRGEMARIVIVGGNDLGFLAAFCDYFLGLSIELKTSSDALLYTTTNDRDSQIVFLFRKPQTPPDTPLTASSQLQSVQKSYVLEDLSSLIISSIAISTSVTSGRVPWSCLFTTVFGEDFEKLLEEHEQCIGQAIGSAARMLLAISEAHDGIPREVLSGWQCYSSTTYGRGFIDFAVTIFPELAIMKSNMLSATKKSFAAAKIAYENQIKTLIISCGCRICTKDNNNEDPERFCRVAIFETILALAFRLADVAIADNLFPKRSGIRAQYKYQVRERRASHYSRRPINIASGESLTSILGPFALVLSDIVLQGDSNRIGRCMEIFTGYYQSTTEEAAIANAGICVYLDALVQGPSDDIETFRKLLVIPGTIEFNDRPYSSICDNRLSINVERESLNFAAEYRQTKLYLTETLDGLRCHFELSADSQSKYPSLAIAPQNLIRLVNKARGWSKCMGEQCQRIADVPDGTNVEVEFHGNKAHIVTGDTITRCIAYCIAEKLEYMYFARDETCVQCVLKLGMGSGLKKYFFTFNRSKDVDDVNRFIIVGVPS